MPFRATLAIVFLASVLLMPLAADKDKKTKGSTKIDAITIKQSAADSSEKEKDTKKERKSDQQATKEDKKSGKGQSQPPNKQ
jgi:hypothetical protein